MRPSSIKVLVIRVLIAAIFLLNATSGLAYDSLKKLPHHFSEAQDLIDSLSRIQGRWKGPSGTWDAIKEYFPQIRELLTAQGVDFNEVNQETSTGLTQVFHILPVSKQSHLNDLAEELFHKNLGLKLIYDPYNLALTGSAAYFSPKDNTLGISHQTLMAPHSNESLSHELNHAQEFVLRLTGHQTPYHGLVQLKEDAKWQDWISAKNTSFYAKYMSFEEVKSYVVSEVFLARQLKELKTFYLTHERELQSFLDLIYHVAETGRAVALQAKDVTERVRSNALIPGKVIWSQTRLLAPESSSVTFRDVVQANIFIDSYSREFHHGEGLSVTHSDKTEVKFYLVSTPHVSAFTLGHKDDLLLALQANMNELEIVSSEVARIFNSILQALPFFIERVDADKVDIQKLDKVLDELENYFENIMS